MILSSCLDQVSSDPRQQETNSHILSTAGVWSTWNVAMRDTRQQTSRGTPSTNMTNMHKLNLLQCGSLRYSIGGMLSQAAPAWIETLPPPSVSAVAASSPFVWRIPGIRGCRGVAKPREANHLSANEMPGWPWWRYQMRKQPKRSSRYLNHGEDILKIKLGHGWTASSPRCNVPQQRCSLQCSQLLGLDFLFFLLLPKHVLGLMQNHHRLDVKW